MTTSAPIRQQIAMEELLRRWEIVKETRNKARRSLHFLCVKMLGYTDVTEEVHWDLIDNLQRFKGGTDDADSRGIVTYTPNVELWHLAPPYNTQPGQNPRNALFL